MKRPFAAWLGLSLATVSPVFADPPAPAPAPAPAAAPAPAPAPAAAPAPAPGDTCKRPRFREFDFWLGDWDVYGPKGKKVGENRITLLNRGCTLAEHWTSASGGEGRSYNAFDGFTRRWYQFWSDDQGGALLLSGGMVDGKMVLEGVRPNLSDGKPQHQRITWTPHPDGSVQQRWESSDDGGKTWQLSFDGTYRKKP